MEICRHGSVPRASGSLYERGEREDIDVTHNSIPFQSDRAASGGLQLNGSLINIMHGPRTHWARAEGTASEAVGATTAEPPHPSAASITARARVLILQKTVKHYH